MTKKLFATVICLSITLFSINGFAAPSESAIRELYQAAKAEGAVVWQVPGSVAMWKPVVKTFREKYPDIDLKVFSGNLSAMPARIITEARAGKLSLDLATSNPESMLPLIERDALEKFDPSATSDLNPDILFMNGLLHNYGDTPLVWVYNTKLVSKKDVPRTKEDLLDPKWKGNKIGLRGIGKTVSWLLPEWRENPQKVVSYLEKLREQEIFWAARMFEQYKRVATGECMIGIYRTSGFFNMKKDGAPIALCPISPGVSTPTGAILPKGVQHPNAARFLLSWLDSSEGRTALDNIRFSPGDPCDASAVARLLCDNGIKHMRIATTAEGAKEYLNFQKDVTKALQISPRKKKK